MQLPSVPREISNQIGPFGIQRHRPPRHRRGLPPVSRFLPTRELSNYRITLLRITSAKTRATATLRQLAHTARRYLQAQANQSYEVVRQRI